MNNIRRLIPLGKLLSFDASKGLPEKVLLFKWGRNETVNGPVVVNEFTASTLPRMQKAAGFDTVALDFEHNTVPGSREYQRSQEPRPVAAHGTPFVRVGEGIGVELLEWTPTGKENAANYVDLSAAASLNEKREVMFLHSGALCRQGAAGDIHLFTAGISDEGQLIKNIEGIEPMHKIIIALFTAAGLTPPKEDATQEQLDASAKELLGKISGNALATFTAQLEALKTQLDGITKNAGKDAGATIQTFTARMDALEKANIERDIQSLLMQASYEGKVVPKSVLPDDKGQGGLTLPALKTFIAELAVTVPLEQRTRIGVKTFTPSANTESPVGKQIRGQLGITDADVQKYGKKA
ncbi:MAG: hypothetical protein HZA88_00550 [Verrucomicrobia bacterium]|nr:hypothetical protein [Verrucomicrobiota bacterium]